MIAFLLASLLLLVAPGPTNTLMALAGVQGGLRQVRGLLLAQLAGYATTIVPLLAFGDAIERRWPGAALVLKIAMAIWVMFLAIRLWSAPRSRAGGGAVTAGGVYVTTVLNPKGWIFGLVLLPGGGPGALPLRLLVLAVLVCGAALAWGSGGTALAGQGGGQRQLLLHRGASLWLGLVSVMLVAQAAGS